MTFCHYSHLRLLAHERCLLIIADENENLSIFYDRLVNIEAAVAGTRVKRDLKSERIGSQPLIAFDEDKRMLAICAVEKVRHGYRTHCTHFADTNDLFSPRYTCLFSMRPLPVFKVTAAR